MIELCKQAPGWMAAAWVAKEIGQMIIEAWLGKTDKVKSGSLGELIFWAPVRAYIEWRIRHGKGL